MCFVRKYNWKQRNWSATVESVKIVSVGNWLIGEWKLYRESQSLFVIEYGWWFVDCVWFVREAKHAVRFLFPPKTATQRCVNLVKVKNTGWKSNGNKKGGRISFVKIKKKKNLLWILFHAGKWKTRQKFWFKIKKSW